MSKQTKKYKAALEKINKDKNYSLEEAVDVLCETSSTKFDSSVEIHMNLNVDVKHADQIVRGTIVLPNGTGKNLRIAVFAESDQVKAAKEAGAEKAGLEELIDEVKKGKLDFDIAIAQPQVMKDLGPIAKNLGTKGLMPNPKAGTVTPNIVEAVKEIKKGKIEFKTDKAGIIHGIVGKVSFGKEKIKENLSAFIDAVKSAKPSGVKGLFIESVFICTTMGPGIKLNKSEI